MIGESDNPVNVKVIPSGEAPAKILAIALLSLAPVAVAILMQNPALRQSLAMKAWKISESATMRISKTFADISAKCQFRYDLARM